MSQETLTLIFSISGAITIVLLVFAFIANHCFYDDDPDMYPNDNYSVLTCPHTGEKTDVTVESNVTCETIHTICDDCGKVLKVRIDC